MSGTGRGAGWKFTVSLPLWINAKDDAGQDVVLYRVNVHLQGPGMPSTPSTRPPFFVLRRYSQFRYLYDQLRAELPDIVKDRAYAPPPKLALHIGGAKELCDRRKQELEAWMWKLIGQPVIARSAALKVFLEWDRALSKAQAAASARALTTGQQGASSSFAARSTYAGSDMGDLDSEIDGHTYGAGDAHSEISSYSHATGFGSGRLGTDLHTSGRFASDLQASFGRDTSLAVPSAPQLPSYSTGLDTNRPGLGLSLGQAESSMGGASTPSTVLPAGSAAVRRLGLKLENRADVRRLMQVLQARLEQAGSDLQAAGHEVATLREANKLLTARLDELETAAASQASMAQVAALQSEVDQMHEQLEALRHELAEAGARAGAAESGNANSELQLEQAREELERAREELAASEDIRLQLSRQLAGAEQAVAGRVALLTSQVTLLQQQLQESHQENTQLLGRLHEWGITSSSQRASADGGAAVADGTAAGSPVKHQASTPPSRSNSSHALVTAAPAEALAALQASLSSSEQAYEEAMAQLATLQASLESEKAAHDADRAKAREHQTILAREVKKLRGELAAQSAKQQNTNSLSMQALKDPTTLSPAPSQGSTAAAAAGTLASRHVEGDGQQQPHAAMQARQDQLQQQLQALQQERDQLQQSLQALQHEHAKVQSELQLVSNKEVGSQAMQQEALEAGQRLQEAEKQLEQTHKELTEQQHLVQELQQQLDEAVGKVASMADQAASTAQQHATQMGDLMLQLQQQQEESSRKLQEAEDLATQQEVRAQQLEAQLDDTTQKVAHMAQQAADATEQNAAGLGSLMLQLQQQQEQVAQKLQAAEDELQQVHAEAAKYKAELAELQAQVDEAQQTVAQLKEQAGAAVERHAAEVAGLTAQLQQQVISDNGPQEAGVRLQEAQAEMAEQRLRADTLQAELDTAMQKLALMVEQVASATAEHAAQIGSLTVQSQQQQEEANQKLQEAEQQLQLTREQLTQHQLRVQELEEQLREAMQKVALMAEQAASAVEEHAAQMGSLTLQLQQQQEEEARKLQGLEQQLQHAAASQQELENLRAEAAGYLEQLDGMRHELQDNQAALLVSSQRQVELEEQLMAIAAKSKAALADVAMTNMNADHNLHAIELDSVQREVAATSQAAAVHELAPVTVVLQVANTEDSAAAPQIHAAVPQWHPQAEHDTQHSQAEYGQLQETLAALQDEVEQLKSEKQVWLGEGKQQEEQWLTQCTELEHKLSRLNSERALWDSERVRWESDAAANAVLQQQAVELTKQLQQMVAVVESRSMQLSQAQTQVEETNLQLQESAKNLQAAEDERARISAENERMQQELAAVQQRYIAVQEQHDPAVAARAQDAAAASAVTTQLSHTYELAGQLRLTEEQLASTQQQLEEAVAHVQTIESETSKVQGELRAAKQQLQQQAIEAEQLQAELASVNEQLHVAQQQQLLQVPQQQVPGEGTSQRIQDLESQLSVATQQMAQVQQQLQQQLADHDAHRKRLEAELDEVKAQLMNASKQLSAAQQQLQQQGVGSEDGDEAQHIRALQQELAAREEALKQQEDRLQALASQVSAHSSAAAAALATLSTPQAAGTLSQTGDQPAPSTLHVSTAQHAVDLPPVAGGPGDDLLMLFDEPAGVPAGNHRSSSASGDHRVSNGSGSGLQPPDFLTGGFGEANGSGQTSHAPLASLRSQASMLRSDLAAAQQQLLQVAADRDKLRQQLAQAKAAQVASRTYPSAVASGSSMDDETWAAQLQDTLQRAADLLSSFRSADTAPALRQLEQAVAAAAQKGKTGSDVMAAAADAAMDAFLLALSSSNQKLEELTTKVQQLHKGAGVASNVSLLDPVPEPALKLQAQLVSLLSELLTVIGQAYSALNELRCDKAMSAAAAVASSITHTPAPARQAQAGSNQVARTASSDHPTVPHSQSMGTRSTQQGSGAAALHQPRSQGAAAASGMRPAGTPANHPAGQSPSGAGLNAVSSILGGGLFGSSAATPSASQSMGAGRGPPMAQSGVFSRWIGGLQGTQQQPPSAQQPQHMGGQRGDTGGYVPPSPVDGDATEDDLWQSLVKKAGH